jgi:outer membrane immunogenic protein
MRGVAIAEVARGAAFIVLASLASGAARAADLAAKAPIYKAPPAIIPNWTGFYVGGGFGYGMFNLDSSLTNNGTVESVNVTNAGRGFFGTVGVGFDYQVGSRFVAGVFADWDGSDINGHFSDPWWERSGAMKQNSAWAVGGRIGYLVNPAVLSYVGGGFTEARFSGTTLTDFGLGRTAFDTMQSQTYRGWFLASGIEAMLPGLPGWSVKTEYRFADYDSKDVTIFNPDGTPSGAFANIRPFVQTVRAGVAYKFGWGREALAASAMAYAPPTAPAVYNWTGFYVGAGGGYGMFNLDSSLTQNGTLRSNNQTAGGRGWFGTVGGGFDYQFGSRFVAGIFADWDGASIKGNWSDPYWEEGGPLKLKSAWYVGGRAGYLIAPDLLAYAGGGFTQGRFSDVNFFAFGFPSRPEPDAMAAQTFNGWFVSAGAEARLPWFPGLSVKSEYRFADYGSKDVPILNQPSAAIVHAHPFVQTVRTALVYRFNAP